MGFLLDSYNNGFSIKRQHLMGFLLDSYMVLV